MKVKISNDVKIYSPPKWLVVQIKKDFKTLNPKWVENNRMCRWNKGVPKFLEFYEHKKKYISVPVGSLETILQTLTGNNVGPSVFDVRIEHNVRYTFLGKLRGFQSDAMADLLEYDAGTIEAPTGSGKTVMGFFAIAYRKQKTLIIVHTKDLAHQWIQRACEFLDLKPFEIGLLGDGSKQIGRRLTIGMVQTCSKMVPELKKEFGMVICDEAHRCPSSVFSQILSQIQCRYRLGLSATMFRRDRLNKIINWYCGPLRHSVSKSQLIEDGHIMQPAFIMKKTQFTTQLDPVGEYSKMISQLTKDGRRNIQILEDIVSYLKDGDVCALVISDRKAHIYELETYLKSVGLPHLVLTGDTPRQERSRATDQIGKGCNLLLSTGQLIGEGFDCKNLNMLFITTPIRFAGRVIQYIGRIMRPAKGKSKPIVIDYWDCDVHVLDRSAKDRMKIYGKENISYG